VFAATPFLQLVPTRAIRCLRRIEGEIWQDRQALRVEWAGSSAGHVSIFQAKRRRRSEAGKPFFWGSPEDQGWFRVHIPKAIADGTWHLEWKEQGESTAYIDNMPYAGLDVAHHTCPIPAGCREIWIEVMALETGIWSKSKRPGMTDKGCRFEGAVAVRRNDLAWEVFHDFDVILNLFKDEYEQHPSLNTPFGIDCGFNAPIEKATVLFRRLARHLEEVVCAFEKGGLRGASRQLKKAYAALGGSTEHIRCRLTGHAHIDLVWLWTEKAAEFKAVHSFATANRLMAEYPEFHFGYSQPASYRAVGQRSPMLMEAVRGRIREGRWEAVGAMEVESDTLIACGECLARSLILGQEGFVDLQGKPSPVLWLPDVFGYSACLPQMMRQCGVSYFFTTKLTWGSITRFPYSSFIWRGPDGSEVVAHVSQGFGYNQTVTPAEARNAAKEYRQSDIHDEFLMPSGYGDGGGGPTPEMCERARRMANLAGTPVTNWGRIDGFFHDLEQQRDRLPAYSGELYLQYHRGVLTTHGDLKAAFRAAERAMQVWEAVHCAAARGAVEKESWRRLVFAQFHDYIPGSSIPEVYAEKIPELLDIADKAMTRAKRILARKGAKQSLFNPLPLPRTVLHNNKLLKIPPLAGISIGSAESIPFKPVMATRNRLRNGRMDARFDARGRIRSLNIDGCDLPVKEPLGQLQLHKDQPHAYDAWDIDRSSLGIGTPVRDIRFLGAHPAGGAATLQYEGTVGRQSKIGIRYIMEPESPVLKVEYAIDWADPEHLLKVLFPTGYRGGHARYGDPFGSTLRSQQPGKPYDEAQWEVSGNRYAIVCDDSMQEGLFVVAESKYGWSCRDGALSLSLLRGVRLPSQLGIGHVPEKPGSLLFSDKGHHIIRLAIGRFTPSAPREEMPAALADTLFTEVLPYRGLPVDSGFEGLEGGSSLVPCWAKPEEDGQWTLRLHETLGARGRARIILRHGWTIERTDLMGATWPLQPTDHQLEYSPYEIISLRFREDSGAAKK